VKVLMINEKLEEDLTWCINNIELTRLRKINRESKKKHAKKNQDRVKKISRPKNLSNY